MLLVVFALLALAFLALVAVVATVGVTLTSLVTLVTAPGQLWPILRDRALRRNHALEHATINVIEERYGPTRLAGLPQPDGFIVRGGASPDLVAEAAAEALARLRAGERRLAIHPRCGTTLLAAQLALAGTFLVALAVSGHLGLLPFLAGLAGAVLLGPRLSPILQRYVTTDADVGDLAIAGVEVRAPATWLGALSLVSLGPVFVRTEPGGRPLVRVAPTMDPSRERDAIVVDEYRVR